MTEPLPASLPAAPLALPYMMFRGRLKSRDFTNTQRSRRTRTVHGDFCSGLLQHRKISAGGQVRNVAIPHRIESLPRSLEEQSPPVFPPDSVF